MSDNTPYPTASRICRRSRWIVLFNDGFPYGNDEGEPMEIVPLFGDDWLGLSFDFTIRTHNIIN